ncbi:MAG: DUF475 domain-containing protein [Actinomycetales bacterium]
MFLKTFSWSILITLAAIAFSVWYFHPAGALLVVVLIVLEVSLSFDNAVVNAKILKRMSRFWQQIFLTIGILIAVFGMRLVFPVLLVSATAGISPAQAINLAFQGGSIDTPGTYAYLVNDAHPAIAGFGGMFLMMLFLDWLFEDKEYNWLRPIEEPLERIGKLDQLSVVIALTALVLADYFLADEAHFGQVLMSGVLGVITYLLVNGLGNLFESQGGLAEDDDEEAAPASKSGPSETAKASGMAGFFLFLYLEVLDASFSFDGVIGAFAITQDVLIIMIGLGVGAFWIRSLTVYLVRKGTLDNYVYLEHGAHWAIGALATILLLTIKFHIPEIVTGLIGVAFILAAFIQSVIRNRQLDAGPEHDHPHVTI